MLAPDRLVQQVDAIVLSGGSAFGLDAASGVADALVESGRGFAVGSARVPIVPCAILFDLLNGGAKQWPENPYKRLGRLALAAASEEFGLGTAGAGAGATTLDLKGGLGSASAVTADGFTVGALVAVNSIGSTVIGGGPQFWAEPFRIGEEFGGGTGGGKTDPGWEPGSRHSRVIAERQHNDRRRCDGCGVGSVPGDPPCRRCTCRTGPRNRAFAYRF